MNVEMGRDSVDTASFERFGKAAANPEPSLAEEIAGLREELAHTWGRMDGAIQALQATYEELATLNEKLRLKSLELALRRVEAERQEAEERFRLFMDNSPTIAWIKDAEGRLVYLNNTFEDRFGVRLADWRGKTDSELWPQAVAAAFHANDQAVLVGGRPMEFDEETFDRDGNRSVWRNCKFPFQDAAGRRYVGGIGVEVTERQRMEEKLRHKQRLLAETQSVAQIGGWVLDISSAQMTWSDETFRLYGLSPETDATPTFEQFLALLDPADRQAMQAWREACMAGKRPPSLEFRVIRPDGTQRWLLGRGQLETGPDGKPQRLFGTVQDITDRRRGEDALRKSEARFRWLFDCDMIGIGYWLWDGTIVDANDALLRLLGYTRKDLSDGLLNWRRLTPPESMPADELAQQQLLKYGIITPFEKNYLHKDGQRIPVMIGAAAHTETLDSGVYFVLDMSERKKAEAQVRRMSMEVALAEERERKMIAQELHDGLGQMLHMMKIRLETLVNTERNNVRRKQLCQLDDLLGEASRMVRNLTAQLIPPVLETLGLIAALSWLADEMERRYGLAVEVDDDGAPKPLSMAQATILFRAVRELLINVVKHAGIDHARVRSHSDPAGLTITVEDSGTGIANVQDALSGRESYGLASILDRMTCLGGILELQAPPLGGTLVRLWMPFPTPSDTEAVP